MVEEQITDGKRIAQLLASELTGLTVGPLAEVTVESANPEATVSETGTLAYHVTYCGETVGSVSLYPDYAELALAGERTWHESVQGRAVSADGRYLQVPSGAAVKESVDALRETLTTDKERRGERS